MIRQRVAIAGGLLLIGCHQPSNSAAPAPRRAPENPADVPAISTVQLSAPGTAMRDTSAGPRVTVNGEMDIRTALSAIADAGGFSIVMPPTLKKRVQVHLIDVPVAQALDEVLRAADLTIEGGTPPSEAWNTSVVFYQLPVNIDSLSVDAIMRRFGVSRTMAEMIVQDRKKP